MSGGILGEKIGYSLMVGGEKAVYNCIKPFLEDIAGKDSYGYVGPSGSGHYVKMVHNGIEYGLLQAYSEGFDLLQNGAFTKDSIDLAIVTGIWKNKSVIRSWLLDLSYEIYADKAEIEYVKGAVAEGGTGLWTAQAAKENNIALPVIEKSLEVRKWSRETGGNYATKMIALLRNKFGGHTVSYIKKSPKGSE